MLACDFLTVESVGLTRLYVLFAVDWTGPPVRRLVAQS
jgi:hypothetical protein